MADEDKQQSVVLDNGSGICKAGFSGDDKPKAVFPAVIGTPKNQQLIGSGGKETIFIGDEAQAKRGICTLSYPIKEGKIHNWADMKKICHVLYENELYVDPKDYPALFTEAPLNPKENRNKIAQACFEDLEVPALYIAIQAVLALYATGRTTGLVLDSGDGVSHTVPIYEGYSIPQAILRLDIAGRHLTDWMVKLLNTESGHSLTTSAEREVVKDIKEKHSYAALDYEEEVKKAKTSSEVQVEYQLPDGEVIKINAERFMCPELLFKPVLSEGLEDDGVHKMAYSSIQKSDMDLRRDLYQNVILSGGTAMINHLNERLQKEMEELAPKAAKIKIVASPERKYLVWMGGSILASLNSFVSMWVTQEEYEEVGVDIIHRKCF